MDLSAIPICIWGLRSIPVCIQGLRISLYAYRDYVSWDPCMHTGIVQIPVCIRGSRLIPVCIRGLHDRSPYPYGDQDQSPYAYGDYMTCNPHMHMEIKINPHWDRPKPRMHTGVKINPCMHTGIACHVIPVYILGLICNPRMHTGIFAIPVCIRGLDGH